MNSERTQPSLAPKAAAAAGKYLSDPLVLSKLTDHVYELLLEDLRSQRERVRNYGTGRWL